MEETVGPRDGQLQPGPGSDLIMWQLLHKRELSRHPRMFDEPQRLLLDDGGREGGFVGKQRMVDGRGENAFGVEPVSGQ